VESYQGHIWFYRNTPISFDGTILQPAVRDERENDIESREHEPEWKFEPKYSC
jgi:hypothetical protein